MERPLSQYDPSVGDTAVLLNDVLRNIEFRPRIQRSVEGLAESLEPISTDSFFVTSLFARDDYHFVLPSRPFDKIYARHLRRAQPVSVYADKKNQQNISADTCCVRSSRNELWFIR